MRTKSLIVAASGTSLAILSVFILLRPALDFASPVSPPSPAIMFEPTKSIPPLVFNHSSTSAQPPDTNDPPYAADGQPLPGGTTTSWYSDAQSNSALTEAIGPPITAANPSPSDFAFRREAVETAVRKQSEEARITAKVPGTMKVGVEEKIEFYVQHGEGLDAVRFVGGPTAAAINVQAPVTYLATARAESRTGNLKITPVTGIPETQSVSYAAPTRWAWVVTPVSSGESEIIFSLLHKVTVSGKELDLPVKHFPQKVNVTVEPFTIVKAWLGDFTAWITLISGLIAAALGLYGLLRPKKAAGP